MTVVTFTDYTPIPRYDGAPWTTILIEEAATADSPWVLIDTIVISPVDADPKNPSPRAFTTNNATLLNGWYRVSFRDAALNVLRTDPIHNVTFDVPEFTPGLVDVGSLLRTRTMDTQGTELGTFTSNTRPTDAQVEKISGKAAREVSKHVGGDIPDQLIDDARDVAALYAAMLIELSYFPEQVGTNRSPYDHYKDLYNTQLASLTEAVQAAEADANIDDTTQDAGLARFNFGPAANLIGWHTRW